MLTLISAHWFSVLQDLMPELKTHFVTLDLPPSLQQDASLTAKYLHRSMQVRRLEVFPIE